MESERERERGGDLGGPANAVKCCLVQLAGRSQAVSCQVRFGSGSRPGMWGGWFKV